MLLGSTGTCVYRLRMCYVLSTAGRCNMQALHVPHEVATVTWCRVLYMSVHAKAVFWIWRILSTADQDMAC